MVRASTVVVLAVCLVAATIAYDVARKKGAHYDEPKHLATGAALLEHGVFVGDDNTPLTALFALPLVARDLDRGALPARPSGKAIFAAGAEFLEKNGVIDTLRPARAVSTILFVVLLLALARLAGSRAGPLASCLAVSLVAFDPTLLAHASIVSADLPLATATLVALLAWRRFLARTDALSTALLLAALTFVLLSKLNGVIVVAVLAAESILTIRAPSGTRRLAALAAAITGAVVIAAACHLGDPGAYFRGLLRVANYGQGTLPQFFDGALGTRSPWFYPAVLAFKTTPAMFMVIVAAVALTLARRGASTAPDRVVGLLLLAFVGAPIVSGYQQGIRFLLPALPLLALVAAPICVAAIESRARRIAFVALASGLAATTAAMQHPHHLAYWNALAGGPDRGDRWFVDSNGDWGQDVPELARFVAQQRVDALYLAAYGSLRPSAYGLEYVDLLAGPSALTPPRPGARAAIAISDTIYRFVLAGGVSRNDPLLPLVSPLSAIEPDIRIAHTIRVWWVTPELVARITTPR